LLSSPQERVWALREQALDILQEQDNDLPREIKSFVRSLVAHDSGFMEVYVLTTDKDERRHYIMHEYQEKTGNVAALNIAL